MKGTVELVAISEERTQTLLQDAGEFRVAIGNSHTTRLFLLLALLLEHLHDTAQGKKRLVNVHPFAFPYSMVL
jgi:hypothetical protein